MTKIYSIKINPDPILRKKAQEFNLNYLGKNESKALFEDMIATMIERDGIGLAAPQIGISSQIITINTEGQPLVLINPKTFKPSYWKTKMAEGCLSVPGISGEVKRPATITVTGILPSGKKYKKRAKGMLARVFQHEIDHLNGILFIDKLEK